MHLSVMLQETIDALAVKQGGCYIDGTLGSAGHSVEILKRAGETGSLLGIDRDPEALVRSRERLSEIPGTICLAHGAHGDLLRIAKANRLESVDGILLDLGVSSDQLDTPERGFSFRLDGPLDMRMDPTQGESAADVIAHAEEAELATLFWKLGEEKQSRRIAKAIVYERARCAITTTEQLAELVSKAVGGKKGPRHPATKVFQALRMRVNREIEDLEQALEDGINLLNLNGRFAVITFESLTDRVVKHTFAAHVGKWRSLQQGGEEWIGTLPEAEWVMRHALAPTEAEMEANPRSRSAKLRVILRKENSYLTGKEFDK
jgi:16S rRNA (cytosine1402-N4)-methyltransferase